MVDEKALRVLADVFRSHEWTEAAEMLDAVAGPPECEIDGRTARIDCDKCGGLRAMSQPDAYFKEPYRDSNLVDVNDPSTRDGIFIKSKRHKAEVMKKLGVREVGDRVGGARNEDKALQRADAKSRRK